MIIENLYNLPLYWEMTNSEKISLLLLLININPKISIEIGTKQGGSLQLISKYSDKVYSLDIDPMVKDLEPVFKNVEFIIGDSKNTLPNLLQQLQAKGETPDFIFIDGDHSSEGVRQDITNALSTNITKTLTILMHDSFNPDCRKGMLQVDYTINKNIQLVDIDFIQGIYSPTCFTHAEMWGGFGLIYLDITDTSKVLVIKESSRYSYEKLWDLSKHKHINPSTFTDKVKSYLFRKLFM